MQYVQRYLNILARNEKIYLLRVFWLKGREKQFLFLLFAFINLLFVLEALGPQSEGPRNIFHYFILSFALFVCLEFFCAIAQLNFLISCMKLGCHLT